MKCPTDSATLVRSGRGDVVIDYSPGCRGDWLDRAELVKIIDRAEAEFAARTPAAAAPVAPAAPAAPPAHAAPSYPDPRYAQQQPQYDNRGYDNRGYNRPKKKESWLSELFD